MKPARKSNIVLGRDFVDDRRAISHRVLDVARGVIPECVEMIEHFLSVD